MFLTAKSLSVDFMERVVKVKVLFYPLIANKECPKFDQVVCFIYPPFSLGSSASVIHYEKKFTKLV